MNRRIAAGLAAAILWLPSAAWAQELADVGQLAQFIRWGGVTASVFVIAGAMVLLRLVSDLSQRLSARFVHRRPTLQKAESITRFSIYLLTVIVCVALSVRLDTTALAVIGGALAFAMGFALRDLVAAFIAGLTIMFDRPFQVGDRVNYAGEYGDIVKIGLRSVRLNTLDHNMVTIPNNKILTDVTASGNYGSLEMQVPMDFCVGVEQDVTLASELIREACLTSPYVHLDQPVPVFARQMIMQDYLVVQLKARPYVFDCRYEKPFETDVHLRVLHAFREHGILPPAILHRQLGDDTRAAVQATLPRESQGT
ncbi:MAG: mechanosensitive ion channel [Gammaproteobacteria bacterium]|jgi:small-conductance mechanosensitive channel|nr:mechanosensitive ion channel [Gammaproteobacteria bacterium]